MTENSRKSLDEKQKATLRKALLFTSSILILISIYSFIDPTILTSYFNTDLETAKLMSLLIGFVGISDFAIAFIVLKLKDRV